MKRTRIESWSGVLPTTTNLLTPKSTELVETVTRGSFITRGAGRSFGDASYLTTGTTISSKNLNQILKFDRKKGVVTVQSGVLMKDLVLRLNGSGWELPVIGGTGWITVGGAVGSDVHGKNHEKEGTIGRHILELELMLPNGRTTLCTSFKHPDLFGATIGGMGLTGLIKSVTFKLRKRVGNSLIVNTTKFVGIHKLFGLFGKDANEYRIGWMDFAPRVPRGIYYSGTISSKKFSTRARAIDWSLPKLPIFNTPVVSLLNTLRYLRMKNTKYVVSSTAFQWKTDAVKNYGRFFGSQGFQEYQFVMPLVYAKEAAFVFLELLRKHKLVPAFIVLKRFGRKSSPGLLSFPLEGYTLNPSFAVNSRNKAFFTEFTSYIITIGGRFNLCKDSSLTATEFSQMYKEFPKWRGIVKKWDPQNKVLSDMAIRLKLK